MTEKIKQGKITLQAACHDQLKELALEDLLVSDQEDVLQEDVGISHLLSKVQNMDMDGDTFHKIREFLTLFFAEYDEDNSGSIEPVELMKLCEDIGEKEIAKPDICKKIILDMDANGDGLMDREEFIKMIMIFFLAKEKFLTFYNKDHIKNTE